MQLFMETPILIVMIVVTVDLMSLALSLLSPSVPLIICALK